MQFSGRLLTFPFRHDGIREWPTVTRLSPPLTFKVSCIVLHLPSLIILQRRFSLNRGCEHIINPDETMLPWLTFFVFLSSLVSQATSEGSSHLATFFYFAKQNALYRKHGKTSQEASQSIWSIWSIWDCESGSYNQSSKGLSWYTCLNLTFGQGVTNS